jgi:hypothetical protein
MVGYSSNYFNFPLYLLFGGRMLIALTGYKGSGKDTVASYMIKNWGFRRYAFADPLKKGIQSFFGWSDQEVNDPVMKEQIDDYWGISPRQAMQWVGTEAMREGLASAFPRFKIKTENRIWIKGFEKFYSQHPHENIVISDCRFQNEIDAVLALEGKIICIKRSNQFPLAFDHKSEDMRVLSGIHEVVLNDLNKEELFSKINKLEVFRDFTA